MLKVTSEIGALKRRQEEQQFLSKLPPGSEAVFIPSKADEARWAELCVVQGKQCIEEPPLLVEEYPMESWFVETVEDS
jgi:hypothetical protein